MDKYSGKNVKICIGGYDTLNDTVWGCERYLRGEVSIDLEPRNMFIDDSLDGGQFVGVNVFAEAKDRGSFSVKQLVVHNNMISVITTSFFNLLTTQPFPLTPDMGAAENKDRLLIAVDDKVEQSLYYGRVNELDIIIDSDEQFIMFESKGDIATYEYTSHNLTANKQKVTGKPFRTDKVTLTDHLGVTYEGIKGVEINLKNGMKLMEVVGSEGHFLPASYEGSGKFNVIWNDANQQKFGNRLKNIETFGLNINALDGDGHALSIEIPAIKLLKEVPTFTRKDEIILREFEFEIVNDGINVPITINYT